MIPTVEPIKMYETYIQRVDKKPLVKLVYEARKIELQVKNYSECIVKAAFFSPMEYSSYFID